MKKAAYIILVQLVLVVSLASCGPGCDPGYKGACIAPPPPDLNCDDISDRNFQVEGRDSHGFDGDNDGIACE